MFRSPRPPSDGYALCDSSHAFDRACRRKTCPGFCYWSNGLSGLGKKILEFCGNACAPPNRSAAAARCPLCPQSGQTGRGLAKSALRQKRTYAAQQKGYLTTRSAPALRLFRCRRNLVGMSALRCPLRPKSGHRSGHCSRLVLFQNENIHCRRGPGKCLGQTRIVSARSTEGPISFVILRRFNG
jgi:hypothetical protein